jgi:predicted nucleic acid-binding protein
VSAVFADTSFYLALLRADDPAHERALAWYQQSTPRIVTSEFIVLELGNACARAEDHADFLTVVEGMHASPWMIVVPLSTELLNRGLGMMKGRLDKDWSLTDCISFVVMEEKRIEEALTADRHFEQAGFKALLK